MPRLNGKFVTQAAYDAATQPAEGVTVSDENTTEEATTATRNVSPLVLATREVTKARARLDKAQAAAQKVTDVQTELAEAEAAYAAASEALSKLL